MPRRSILSNSERDNLIVFPDDKDELIRYYTFSETDLSIIKQRRGSSNRLGFAMQLCYLRFPGIILGVEDPPFPPLLEMVAKQIEVSTDSWKEYGKRSQTRREHILEIQRIFGFKLFTASHYKNALLMLTEIALQTDKGIILANSLIEDLRKRAVILPTISVIERACSEAITRANRDIYSTLSDSLESSYYQKLDNLLSLKDGSNMTWLVWLSQSPVKANSRHMIEHINRLKYWQDIDLPNGLEGMIHQNRLLKLSREGRQMTASNLAKLETQRRYATLVALTLSGTSNVIDEIIELHDRIIGRLFNVAKKKHQQKFHKSGKSINEKLRLFGEIGQALLNAKKNGTDAFLAIDSIISWDAFTSSVSEAQDLSQPEDFDFLHHIGENYTTLRRYSPEFLNVLKLRATPASKDLFEAIEVIREMNRNNTRRLPDNVPTKFIKKRWAKLVINDNGIDRRYYELCVLSELKNSLRSGDMWVLGSRQFKDFNEYLIPSNKFDELRLMDKLPLAITNNCDQYLHERLSLLEQKLDIVNRMAADDDLPDAIITESGLKITPLNTIVPAAAQDLICNTSALLPRIKITELLMEVDKWTHFTRHFTHMKSENIAKDKTLLLTAILADGINLGLSKMAEACPGMTYSKLSWIQAWHIRDETYSKALAELVNAQLKQPLSSYWGDGTTSSSDGQRFRATSKAENTGHINPKYGAETGRLFYTHVSDTYAPFNVKVVNVGVRDSTYVLDGLLHHESSLKIEEHYTDTAGFTDHVFGLMHLLGFRFAPRIRDLGETKLFIPKGKANYNALKSMISSDRLNVKAVRSHWDEILRFSTSIKQGTVTASLMLKKIGSYSRQNGLSVALRELGHVLREHYSFLNGFKTQNYAAVLVLD